MSIEEMIESRGDKILSRKRIEDPLSGLLSYYEYDSWIEELEV